MPPAVNFDNGNIRATSQFPNRAPTRGKTLQRGKTLSRPERFVEPTPLLTPGVRAKKASWFSPWTAFSRVVTFWAPGFMLSAFGKKDPATQQAWREKIALCFIALLMGCIVGFITVGLSAVLCPTSLGGTNPADFLEYRRFGGVLGVLGWSFNITRADLPSTGPNFYTLSDQAAGQDITNYFQRTSAMSPACAGSKFAVATTEPCFPNNGYQGCPLGQMNASTFAQFKITNTSKHVGYDWTDLAPLQNYFVIDGNVLNMGPYIAANPKPITNDPIDLAIRTVIATDNAKGGKDATRLFFNNPVLRNEIACIVQKYYAGHIDKDTPGCFVAQLFLYFSLVVILSIVLTRFAMAMIFSWFISAKLTRPPKHLNRSVVSPHVLPNGAAGRNANNGAAPWGDRHVNGTPQKVLKMSEIGAELFTVCLVTAYSEAEDGIRTTIESIAGTKYPDERKLILLVADGIITGSGQTRTTPDICVGLMEQDPQFASPQALSYVAVASGSKQHNLARVYAGHYTSLKGHRTPMIVIVKTGTPAEAKGAKPGNRGKRDSQLILMNFFSRVTFNERMTPLDYDMFRKIHALMGVTPDFFEVVLMVDADTKVYPDSLKKLVNCLQNDPLIMGVCGETRIANKRDSWVTAIQVFEYYISHHLGKGFESVFGGVTCLPGCFCCYRLKARRKGDDDWIPILTKPEIVKEYSQNTVDTLHQKNLLLLGEDRFLSTLMLRNFPTRKMMFCPQAVCRTIVPDEFRVLLSQRRRWINSTIHNLMELVLVRNLCGTFCFSMQFVVFMELIGTTVLPVAICLTYSLIVHIALNPPKQFSEAIPVALLCIILFAPGVLILVTTRKVVYVAWMFIYLLALPIWNFVLPVYAYWHFDDFSWGETRKVEGDSKDDHGKKEGLFDVSSVPLRRWEDWERSRLKKIRREEKRRKELEASFGSNKFYNGNGKPMYGQPQHQQPMARGPPPPMKHASSYYGESEDTQSYRSSLDDQWHAMQDNNSRTALVPTYNGNGGGRGLYPPNGPDGRSSTLGDEEMQRMLDDGWDDNSPGHSPGAGPPSPISPTYPGGHPLANGTPPLYNNRQRHSPPVVADIPTAAATYQGQRMGQSSAVGYQKVQRRAQSGGRGVGRPPGSAYR